VDDAAGWIEELNNLHEKLAGGKNIESPAVAEFQSRRCGELRRYIDAKAKSRKGGGLIPRLRSE
jgi:hypothetical protein